MFCLCKTSDEKRNILIVNTLPTPPMSQKKTMPPNTIHKLHEYFGNKRKNPAYVIYGGYLN